MSFQTLAQDLSLPARTLRACVDRALFIAALLMIVATTLAVHPGSTRETLPVAATGER